MAISLKIIGPQRVSKSIWMDGRPRCGEVAHAEAAMNKSASGSQPLIPIAAVLPDKAFNIYSAVFAESRSSDVSLRHEGSWRTLREPR